MLLLTADDFSILLLTLKVAATSTLVIFPLGVGWAWLLSRWRRPTFSFAKNLLETALSLPLVLPPTAVGILLLELLQRHGPLGIVFRHLGVRIVFTWRAVVLASAVMSFPLLVRPARAAFDEIDPHLLDVARTLGYGRLGVFLRVTMPLAWRGLLTGTLLAFSRALGEFGATIIVAGNIPGRTQTLALAIFQRAESGDDQAATRLVVLTVIIAFAAVWGSEIASRRRTRRLAA
jgi:molybdate transport system permease protein